MQEVYRQEHEEKSQYMRFLNAAFGPCLTLQAERDF